jgi:hypothetical protein
MGSSSSPEEEDREPELDVRRETPNVGVSRPTGAWGRMENELGGRGGTAGAFSWFGTMGRAQLTEPGLENWTERRAVRTRFSGSGDARTVGGRGGASVAEAEVEAVRRRGGGAERRARDLFTKVGDVGDGRESDDEEDAGKVGPVGELRERE